MTIYVSVHKYGGLTLMYPRYPFSFEVPSPSQNSVAQDISGITFHKTPANVCCGASLKLSH